MSVLLLLVCFQALEKTEEQSGMDNRETQATLSTMYRTKGKQRKKTYTHTHAHHRKEIKRCATLMCNTNFTNNPWWTQLLMARMQLMFRIIHLSCYSLKFRRSEKKENKIHVKGKRFIVIWVMYILKVQRSTSSW